ncbi:MAG: glutamine-hydrolyzing GMP synthase, partial [Deltaproteobacteria bacterium]|nr:glutamine-hydrolyzing GMP synthase [Deltaproteobacteria bacterium]
MHKVLILDFGSQYTQLIARRIREMQVYCEIHPCNIPLEQIFDFKPQAVILSGGPASVLAKGSPKINPEIFEMGIPVLGICYGMQLMAHLLGGKVVPAKHREYGRAIISQSTRGPLFSGLPEKSAVWMSHGDSIHKVPPGFTIDATTENGIIAAMSHSAKKFYALQFHPEVVHTEIGEKILRNFLFGIGNVSADWNMHNFIERSCTELREKIGKKKVILGLSGGVDSSVAAVLLHKAIGNQLTCIFINNGLLRKNEAAEVEKIFKKHYRIRL